MKCTWCGREVIEAKEGNNVVCTFPVGECPFVDMHWHWHKSPKGYWHMVNLKGQVMDIVIE